MAYTLQAIIAKSGALPSHLPGELKRVSLSGGVDMIPIGRAALKAQGFSFCPLIDEGEENLPHGLAKLCEQLSAQCQLAYVEAEYFGGEGTQANALFSAGKLVSKEVLSDSAVNEALRYIGVEKGDAVDEFDAVGLGQRRTTDGWLI